MRGFLLTGDTSEMEKELAMAEKMITQAGLEIERVDIGQIRVAAQNGSDRKIRVGEKEVDCPDFVIVGMLAESHEYQSMAVLRMFESMGVLCINPISTMAMTSDKLLTFQVAQKAVPEIKIPRTMLVTAGTTAAQITAFTGLPLVLKIMHGSMGKGITLVEDEKTLENMLSMLFAAPFQDQVIAQQAIMSSKGRDIRLILMGGTVIHSFVRRNDGSFKSNVKQGGYLEEFEAPENLKRMSEKLAAAMDLKMGSVDYMFGENEGEFYLCEANSMPGFTYLFDAWKKGDQELIQRFLSALRKMIAGGAA